MEISQLPFNRLLGIQPCTTKAQGLFQLPDSPDYTNHLGTVHASALYSLAEASSGAFLAQHLTIPHKTILPVVRRAEIKYRKPARGMVYARGVLKDEDRASFENSLAKRKRALLSFRIDVLTDDEVIVATASFDWFIALQSPGESATP